MMSERFNKLTPAQDERLSYLAEECAEVIQVVMKIKRHGFDSYNPFDNLRPTNRRLLKRELSQVQAAMNELIRMGDIDPVKAAGFPYRWMHYNFVEQQ